MLLGKRQRPPIKRTASMTRITVDVSNLDEPTDEQNQNHMKDVHAACANNSGGIMNHNNIINGYNQRFLASMLSPRDHRRNMYGHDFLENAQFLRICGLCSRSLAPGKDIYMYRGDTAFCSLECREQQMKQDEKKEQYASKKDNHHGNQKASSSKGYIRAGQ